MIQMAKRPAKRKGIPLQVYVDKDTRAALKQFLDEQRLAATLTDTSELAIQEFLRREGFWPYNPNRKPTKATDAD